MTKSNNERYKDVIANIRRPSRYLGNERNIIIKDPKTVSMTFALAFPDLYEIGMSNLGLAILYHLLNSHDEIAAERVFAPWPDFALELEKRKLLLGSLETGRYLKDFDIVGFSIPFELCFTNILNMMKLGGIEPLAEKRGENLPLVIGGGPQAANPEPIAELFDAILFGEGEEVVPRICEDFIHWKKTGGSKEDLLKSWSQLPGVYVPGFYSPVYGNDGKFAGMKVSGGAPEKIRRTFIKDLDSAPFPLSPLVPVAKLVHDRINLEIARGCTNGCRFCQAGMIYRPVRERSCSRLIEILKQSLQNSGYEEASLLSLSSGDYSEINNLLAGVMGITTPQHVSVSMPSLRVKSLTGDVIKEIKKVRKTGFTIAPEAASERLQRVINKRIPPDDLFKTVEQVFSAGWNSLKLYFMIGLPTETEADILEIERLSKEVLRVARGIRKVKQLSISISPHVPKPHTPFQWEQQLSLEEMQERLGLLKDRIRGRSLQVKWQDPRLSVLESVFARGDRRLLPVILKAYELGCQFDGWSDHFNWENWLKAFEMTETDMNYYLVNPESLDSQLPWDHLDTGVDRGYLKQEIEHARKEKISSDCRADGCHGCGVCDADMLKSIPSLPDKGEIVSVEGGSREGESEQPFPRARYRVCYSKTGSARWFSHLELMVAWQRILRRSGLPLAFTRGYNKKPIISYGRALPVGVSSLSEYFDFEMLENFDVSAVQEAISKELPAGIEVKSVEEIKLKGKSISATIKQEKYIISGGSLANMPEFEVRSRINQFLGQEAADSDKRIKELILTMEIENDGELLLEVKVPHEGALNPVRVINSMLGNEADADKSQLYNITKIETILG